MGNKKRTKPFYNSEIPSDWEVKKFKDFSKVVRGGSPRPAGSPLYFNGSFIPWITVASLTNIPLAQQNVLVTESFLTEEGSKLSRVLEKGTLILSNSGATLGVAKVLGLKCCAIDGIAAFIDWDLSQVNVNYALHFLNSQTNFFRDVIAPGNGQPNLNTELIGTTSIPLPPLREQTAIAQLLNTWDNAIAKTQALISQKELRKKWMMQNLLTGKKRLNGFSEKWNEIYIRDVANEVSIKNRYDKQLTVLSCTKYNGLVPSLEYFGRKIFSDDLSTYKVVPRNHFAYATNHIEESSIVYQENFKEALISPMYTVFKTDSTINNHYFFKLLKSHLLIFQYNERMEGSIDRRGGLRWYAFSIIKIQLPKIEEQTAILKVLQNVDKEIQLLKNELDKLKEQKNGLMQILLTGKKRLRA